MGPPKLKRAELDSEEALLEEALEAGMTLPPNLKSTRTGEVCNAKWHACFVTSFQSFNSETRKAQGVDSLVVGLIPGLGVSHAMHFVASGLLFTMHVSHSHVPAAGLNLSPKPGPVGLGMGMAATQNSATATNVVCIQPAVPALHVFGAFPPPPREKKGCSRNFQVGSNFL